jgi:hypothetical protein
MGRQVLLRLYSPIYARDINYNIYHIAAKLIALHVYRRGVGGYVNLGYNVKQERLLDSRILLNNKFKIRFVLIDVSS